MVQFGDHFLQRFFGQVSRTCQGEALFDFEVIKNFYAVDFFEVPFHFDILVTLQDFVNAFENILGVLAILEKVALNHRHGEFILRQFLGELLSYLFVLKESITELFHLIFRSEADLEHLIHPTRPE